jgi:hypothetical protein
MTLFRTLLREVTVKQLRELGRFQKVFNAHAPVIMRDDLPALKVWTPDDSQENISIGAPELLGNLTLAMQIVIEGEEDEANVRYADDLCDAVVHNLLEDSIWLQFMNRVLSLGTSIETNTEGEMRTVTATITMNIAYGDLSVTRIVDYLDREHYKLPIPGQPEPPPGEAKEVVEFEVTYPRWPNP